MDPSDSDKQETLATLEEPGSEVLESAASPAPDQPAGGEAPVPPARPTPPLPRHRLKSWFKRAGRPFNVYLLALAGILCIAVAAIVISIRANNRQGSNQLPGQSLSAEELSRLQGTDASVGDAKQTLTIESNTIINGRTLVRNDLDVAGTIKVGGSLNLPGITVAGTSSFEQIQASRLSITGDTTVQGQLSIQQNLTVTGSASFGGAISASQLNIQVLSLSGNLQLNRHIDAGGGTPTKSDGNALGSGGTASVNGSDTAGTITLNTGGSPSGGCYITVTFAQRFNATPHVTVTPVGSGAAGLNYYITRTATSFNLCATNAPPASTSFSFDYIAID